MTTRNKLGLILPDDPYGKTLRLKDFFDHAALAAPAVFGHEDAVADWGMLGNDQVGDCVIAADYHLLLLLNALGGHPVSVSTETAISTYSAATGYVPGDPSSDQGADIDAFAAYWQQNGLLDDSGTAHHILTSLSLNPRDLDQAAAAADRFAGISVGFDLPESAQDQFQEGVPWTVTSAPSEGGHAVAVIGRNNAGNFLGVTWDAIAEITPGFMQKYGVVSRVHLSVEEFRSGESPEGLNLAQLQAVLGELPSI